MSPAVILTRKDSFISWSISWTTSNISALSDLWKWQNCLLLLNPENMCNVIIHRNTTSRQLPDDWDNLSLAPGPLCGRSCWLTICSSINFHLALLGWILTFPTVLWIIIKALFPFKCQHKRVNSYVFASRCETTSLDVDGFMNKGITFQLNFFFWRKVLSVFSIDALCALPKGMLGLIKTNYDWPRVISSLPQTFRGFDDCGEKPVEGVETRGFVIWNKMSNFSLCPLAGKCSIWSSLSASTINHVSHSLARR